MTMKFKYLTITSALFSLSSVLPLGAHAVELGEFKNTQLSFKGFIKFDALASQYSDGTLPPQSLGRDFYIPSLTPVGGEEESTQVDFHVRTSRFGFGTQTDMDGDTLKTYIELDFAVSAGGNERVSNSYSARIRHAFLTYNHWLFGQTWTTFQNVSSLPETVDFIGNADAGTFGRQAMLRYSRGGFQFALENPETTVTPNGGGGRIVSDDNAFPDLVLRYDLKRDNYHLSFAALARELSYIDEESNIDSSTTGGGISFSGTVKLGQDDLKFAFNTGSGMGRYIGLNIANGAVLDANNQLEAIDSTGYYAAYRHWWNDKWRSSVSYSAIEIDNNAALTGGGVSKFSESARLNLMYSPKPKLTYGGEITQAEREIESGDSGSMLRLQFTAKLVF